MVRTLTCTTTGKYKCNKSPKPSQSRSSHEVLCKVQVTANNAHLLAVNKTTTSHSYCTTIYNHREIHIKPPDLVFTYTPITLVPKDWHTYTLSPCCPIKCHPIVMDPGMIGYGSEVPYNTPRVYHHKENVIVHSSSAQYYVPPLTLPGIHPNLGAQIG